MICTPGNKNERTYGTGITDSHRWQGIIVISIPLHLPGLNYLFLTILNRIISPRMAIQQLVLAAFCSFFLFVCLFQCKFLTDCFIWIIPPRLLHCIFVVYQYTIVNVTFIPDSVFFLPLFQALRQHSNFAIWFDLILAFSSFCPYYVHLWANSPNVFRFLWEIFSTGLLDLHLLFRTLSNVISWWQQQKFFLWTICCLTLLHRVGRNAISLINWNAMVKMPATT